MKAVVWSVVGLCAAVLAGLVLLLGGAEPGAPVIVASQPEDPAARSNPAAPRAVGPAPASRRVATESRGVPAEAVIHGRCLAAESGVPLSGCEVGLRGFARAEAAAGEQDWRDPIRVVTGADGGFRIAFVPSPGFHFGLAVRCAGRCRMSGFWPGLVPGQDVDLGDLALVGGTRIIGSVVDTAGAPAAGVGVSLSQRSGRSPGAFGQLDLLVATSKAGGTLEVMREVASPGEWQVSVRGDDELVEPRVLVVRAGQAQARLDVVVRRPSPKDFLSGTVVDETGAPAEGMTLTAHSMGLRSVEPMYCTTGADGGFAIRRREDAGEPVLLSGWSDARAYEPLHEARTFKWGTTGIRLTVRRAGAVEDFAVFCFPEGSSGRVRSPDQHAPHHEGGRAAVPGVALGRNYLFVVPKDPALRPRAPVFFTRAEAGTPPLRVALERASTLRVQVVRADGSPVRGTKLELVRHWGPESSSERVEGGSDGTMKYQASARSIAVVLAEGTTDDAGRADLPASGSGGELTLKVLGPGHVPETVERVQATTQPFTVVVTTGATLRGTVEPVAALRRTGPEPARGSPSGRPGLWLATASHPTQLFPPSGPCPVGEDGSFAIVGIPPGSWKISFVYSEPTENQFSAESRALGTVDHLLDGEVREVRLDASALVPGRLRGTILVDGTPWARSFFWLRRALPDSRGGKHQQAGSRRLATSAEGGFELEVHPGFHKVFVVLPRSAGGNEIRLESSEWIWLGPGQELDLVFELAHRRALVRVLSSDGVTPVRARKLQARGDEFFKEGVTDAEGMLVIDPAPARLQLTLVPELAADRPIALDPVEFPAGQRELRCERRLPTAK